MKSSPKFAIWFFAVHSIAPIFVFIKVLRISDGTERWANSLPLYWLDFPIHTIYLYFQDSPRIGDSTPIIIVASFFLGGGLYALLGWLLGNLLAKKTKK